MVVQVLKEMSIDSAMRFREEKRLIGESTLLVDKGYDRQCHFSKVDVIMMDGRIHRIADLLTRIQVKSMIVCSPSLIDNLRTCLGVLNRAILEHRQGQHV
jgi:hypothetical protein